MDKLINISNQEGKLVVSSREVARNFGKRHDNVLMVIEILVSNMGSPEKSGSLFIPAEYQHEQNKQTYREYLLTRDGFSLLVMGFTGKEALEWKLKYIDAFNRMESALKERQPQTSIQALQQAVNIIVEQEKRISLVENQVASTAEQVQTIKETFIEVDEDWRRDINTKLNRIAHARGGGDEYQLIKRESYIILNDRAHCNLEQRLNNLRERMKRQGETATNIRRTTYLDVIERDPRVKEIYTTIVKEMAIRHLV